MIWRRSFGRLRTGIRDMALLESAVARAEHHYLYADEPTVLTTAAALGYGLAMNHPFVDGNKRVSYSCHRGLHRSQQRHGPHARRAKRGKDRDLAEARGRPTHVSPARSLAPRERQYSRLIHQAASITVRCAVTASASAAPHRASRRACVARVAASICGANRRSRRQLAAKPSAIRPDPGLLAGEPGRAERRRLQHDRPVDRRVEHVGEALHRPVATRPCRHRRAAPSSLAAVPVALHGVEQVARSGSRPLPAPRGRSRPGRCCASGRRSRRAPRRPSSGAPRPVKAGTR